MKYEPFVLERTFKAPIDLLWSTFTQAEHLKNWMASQERPPEEIRWISAKVAFITTN